ncbi:Ro-like RNA binding protein [Microbacterium phage Cece]|nr:Ro-like RNA binding protein [Microbacterium phage Cece]
MSSSLKTVKTRKGMTATPQTQKARPEQIKNAAGGYTFKVEDLDRVKRFLILGAETNYYTPGAEMAKENADTLIRVVSTDEGSKAVVDLIVEYSTQGRAPKQDAGLFALALASSHGSDKARGYALAQLSKVARTGTTLIQFVNFALQFRGWGRALKRAVAEWYTDKPVDKVAFQAVKYRQREGWTHRDLFRTAHPVTTDPAFQALGRYILKGEVSEASPRLVQGFTVAQAPGADVPALIREYGLSWEMVPTQSLNDREVWDALMDANLPLGALLRNLPKLTNLGFFEKMKDGSRLAEVVKRLTDQEEVERARLHPVKVLEAMRTYANGHSERGSSTWTPSRDIIAALDTTFRLSFKNVTPSGKRTLIGLDVSGSMGSTYGGILSAREITGAIATYITATEPETHVIGFTGGSRGYGWGYGSSRTVSAAGSGKFGSTVTELSDKIDPSRRLDDILASISGLPFGSTDVSLPMLYALEKGLRPEVFVIMTDNDTYAGTMQPHEALEKYRRETGIDARLIVLSTVASRNKVIDPKDKFSLDIAGFDSAAPQLMSSFARGDF